MTPINNSDTAWLIIADYNQDNDLPHEELREDIINPNINCWCCEYKYSGVGNDYYQYNHCGDGNYIGVGDCHYAGVDVGGGIISYYSILVGGHPYDSN